MKYCKNCGNEVKEDMNYCTKCGSKIKKEVDVSKIVLLVGVFVVLFSSFAFGIVSWNDLNELFRLCFFGFETLLFFVLSLALKKISNKTSRIFFVIGLILIPFTLSLIPYYGLLTDYFRSGPGLYIYLSIIYFITFIVYLLINIKFKSNIVNYLALLSLLLSFISVAFIFDLGIVLISLLIVIYLIIINVLSKVNLFNEKFRKALSNFSLIFGLVYVPFILYSFSKVGEVYSFINFITLILYAVDAFFKLSYDKKSVLRGFNPYTLSLLTFTYIDCNLFDNYYNIALYALTISFILLFYISLLFDSKLYSITSLVISYIVFFIVICSIFFTGSYLTLLIISLIIFIFNISVLLIEKYNVIHYILPINYIITANALCKSVFDINALGVITLIMILYLITYLVLKLIINKHYLVYIISTLGISIISFLFINEINMISIITLCIFLISFILTSIFKEHISLRIISYIIFNIGLAISFTDPYYPLLFIGGITIISSILIEKITKLNYRGFILYAEILILIISLFNTFEYPLYILGINVLFYALAFISLIKYHNKAFYRIIYVILGFILINRFMNMLIDVTLFSSIISFTLMFVIITVLYLLDKEKNGYLIIESLAMLIPYFTFVNTYYFDIIELYLVPLVVYDLIVTSALKYKSNETKKLLTLIPLSILAYFFLVINNGVPSIIFDILYTLVFIITGLVRRYNLLIFFGIGFLILTTIFNLFAILNSLAIVIILLIVGFILIGISLFLELRKKN